MPMPCVFTANNGTCSNRGKDAAQLYTAALILLTKCHLAMVDKQNGVLILYLYYLYEIYDY